MIKKIFSYLIPIKIYQAKSSVSKAIKVAWINGELVLDSENTNYSYGGLQRILRLGLNNIGFDKIVSMNHILVLGVAGGSVIKTLANEIKFQGKITGVEIDPEVIKIANTYFKLNAVENLEIIIDDAFEFVLKTKNSYDLIIVDIFEDMAMPNFLFQNFFIKRICFLLNEGGFILFNTIILNENHSQRNNNFVAECKNIQLKIKTLSPTASHNELFIIENVIKT
ncbi:MAG: fused MFS/spermidine synthase [Flavobacterium micromati]|nr:fused MFS/spermidine synthase [Flavobacterium micromati]